MWPCSRPTCRLRFPAERRGEAQGRRQAFRAKRPRPTPRRVMTKARTTRARTAKARTKRQTSQSRSRSTSPAWASASSRCRYRQRTTSACRQESLASCTCSKGRSSTRATARRKLAVSRFDLETRKTEQLVDGVAAFALSANGEKMLVRVGEKWSITAADKTGEAGRRHARDKDLQVWVDPRAEWRQMYRESWRIERDFFYDRTSTVSTWRRRSRRTPRTSIGSPAVTTSTPCWIR